MNTILWVDLLVFGVLWAVYLPWLIIDRIREALRDRRHLP